MLDRIKNHPILVICGFLVLLTAGAGAIGKWTDFSFYIWASASGLEAVEKKIGEVAANERNNRAGDLRLRQQIINDTRDQREERKLPTNPRWLKQQQQQLNYDRCKYAQRFDKKKVCVK